MIEDLVNHEIYARNLIMGQVLFFNLNLPPEWHLAPGVSRPEINASSRQTEDGSWVVNGNAWYVVYQSERRWALELYASIRPLIGQKSGRRITPNGGPVNIAGHNAELQWNTKRRGLPWKRHDVTFMTLTFDCPHTERRIKLEFSGWCPQEGFEEILESMRHLKCH